MGLLRPVLNWVICHTVAVVLAGFMAIAIVFRGPLFGVETETAQADLPEAGPVLKTEASRTKSPDSNATITKSTISQSAIKQSASKKVNEPAPQQVPADKSVPVTQLPATLPAVIEPVSPQTIATEQGATFRPDTIDIETDAQPASAFADQQQALIQKARRAYWNDQLPQARAFYTQYIERFPDNPDGHGELGNLLSTLGELDTAAAHYQKAADLMKQQGNDEQADKLYQVLESIRIIQTSGK